MHALQLFRILSNMVRGFSIAQVLQVLLVSLGIQPGHSGHLHLILSVIKPLTRGKTLSQKHKSKFIQKKQTKIQHIMISKAL